MNSHDELEGEVLRARMALLALYCANGASAPSTSIKYIINRSGPPVPLPEAVRAVAKLSKPVICQGAMEKSAFGASFKAVPPHETESHVIGAREQSQFVERQLNRVKLPGLEFNQDSTVLFGRDGDQIAVQIKDLEHWFGEYSLREWSLSIGAAPPELSSLGTLTISPPGSITGFRVPL